MIGEWFLASFFKIFYFITSPVTLLVGLFLIFDFNTYQQLEGFLGKNYGFSKVLVKGLEKNRQSFHVFLLKKRRVLGLICVLNSVVSLLISLFFAKLLLAKHGF